MSAPLNDDEISDLGVQGDLFINDQSRDGAISPL